MTYVIVAIGAYLLGSIPFGIVMAKLFNLGDLRQIGSGNIGATNVLRSGNKLAAFLTLVFDSGKGAIAVILARIFAGEDLVGLAGLYALIGHLYPVFLGFKGGKGMATFLGTLLAISFPVGLAACATWSVTALISRISSLSALVAAALAPVFTFFFYDQISAVMVLLMALLVFYRHGDNIRRLRTGREPKIGQGK